MKHFHYLTLELTTGRLIRVSETLARGESPHRGRDSGQ